MSASVRLHELCCALSLLLTLHCAWHACASFLQVEELDLAMRKKDKDSALAKLAVAKANLDSVIANVL